jgi:hypothetical protein
VAVPDAAGNPLDVYEALVQRFTLAGLDQVFTGGLVVAEEVPGTNFPYAVLDPGGEPVVSRTNRTRYRRPLLQVSVYDRTFELVKRWVTAVQGAVDLGPFTLAAPAAALSALPGGVRYQQEQDFWRGMIDVEFTEARPGPANR